MTKNEALEYWGNLRKTFSENLQKEENILAKEHWITSIEYIDWAIRAISLSFPKEGLDQESFETCDTCASCIHSIEAKINIRSPCSWCNSQNHYMPRNFCQNCGRPLTEKARKLRRKEL